MALNRLPFLEKISADGSLTCQVFRAEEISADVVMASACLRDLGRDMTSQWLDTRFECIGKKSSVDLRVEFIGSWVAHRRIFAMLLQ
jgi:hypothetical protein